MINKEAPTVGVPSKPYNPQNPGIFVGVPSKPKPAPTPLTPGV